MDPVENINITFSVLLLGQCHTQEEKKFQFHSKCGNKSPFVSSPPSLWHKLMTPILSFSVKGYKMKQWLSCFSSSNLTVSKSTTWVYSVAPKGLFRVARIELESSVIGQLAGCGQAELLAALWWEFSKPTSKPFWPPLYYQVANRQSIHEGECGSQNLCFFQFPNKRLILDTNLC